MESVISILISGLVLFAVAQQFFFMRQIQKLVDKVMSRSYTEYVRAEKPAKKETIIAEPAEDLRALQEFQI